MHRSLAKYRAKQILAPLGLRFRPGAHPRASLAASAAHLRKLGVRPATVIDVGVADGTFELYDNFPDARLLLVEPMHEFSDTLEFIAQRYGATVVEAVADAEAGERTVSVLDDLHAVSLLRPAGGRQRSVPAVRLDDVCREHLLTGPYLLKVDVQGAELRVLEGAPEVLALSEVVILETSLFRFNPSTPELADVVIYLRERGLVPYDLFGGYTRPLDGALAQIDVVFVPENSPLRANHAFGDPAELARDHRLIAALRRRARI
jgi:FkbM family methyltransferase